MTVKRIAIWGVTAALVAAWLAVLAGPATANTTPCSPDTCDSRLCTTTQFTIYGNETKAFYLYGANDFRRGWQEYVYANSTPIASYSFVVNC